MGGEGGANLIKKMGLCSVLVSLSSYSKPNKFMDIGLFVDFLSTHNNCLYLKMKNGYCNFKMKGGLNSEIVHVME